MESSYLRKKMSMFVEEHISSCLTNTAWGLLCSVSRNQNRVWCQGLQVKSSQAFSRDEVNPSINYYCFGFTFQCIVSNQFKVAGCQAHSGLKVAILFGRWILALTAIALCSLTNALFQINSKCQAHSGWKVAIVWGSGPVGFTKLRCTPACLFIAF